MKYLFSTILWGTEYAARFADWSLPTQLARGNLEGFPDIGGSTYQLLTRREDAPRVTGSPAWKRLEATMTTEVRYLDGIEPFDPGADKYGLMSQYQREVLKSCLAYDVIHFGYADLIWAEGALQAAARRMAEGCDAVFAPGLPVLEGPFVAALGKAAAAQTGGAGAPAVRIPARDLVKLTLDNLHPLARLNVWRSGNLSLAPAFQIWEVAGQGALMRWFHLHPVFMRTRIDGVPLDPEFPGSLDEGLVPRAVSGLEKVYLMTDSDEAAFCSLMPDWSPGRSQFPCSAMNLSHWAESYARFLHREFFKVPFRFHHQPVDSNLWQPAERLSAAVAAEVGSRLALPDAELRRTDLYAYWLRHKQRGTRDFWIPLAVASGMLTHADLTARQIVFLLLQKIWGTILGAAGRAPFLAGLLRAPFTRRVSAKVRRVLTGRET